mgnify:CR=1 FL=1
MFYWCSNTFQQNPQFPTKRKKKTQTLVQNQTFCMTHFSITTNNSAHGAMDFRVSEANNNTPNTNLIMHLKKGAVGIATASPLATLHVEHTTDDTDERKYLNLKLYLISEPYFKHFTSEPAWLTRDIIKDFNK